jgi:multiple sugar transport system substrate-binding protein
MTRGIVSRRGFLGWAGVSAAAAALVACGPNAAPTVAPAKPTEAPKPAAAESTKPAAAAPAATTAPAAAPTTAPAAGAATAPAAAKPSTGAVSGKVTVYSGFGMPGQKVYEAWPAEFMKDNPNIQAELITVVGGQPLNDKVLALIAGGTPPDLWSFYQEIVPVNAAVDKKLNKELDDYVKADKYDIDAFLPQSLALNQWDGKLWAIPRDYGDQNIYYNVDLFKKANLPLPPTDWEDKSWTYDKFLEAAKALTVQEGGKTTQWGFAVNTAWRPWASFVYSNGAAVVNKDAKGVATDFSITDPAAVEGLQFLADLLFKNKVSPTPDAFADQGMQGFFGTGKVGMVIDNPSAVGAYMRFDKFEWDIAPFPLGPKGTKRGVGGGGTAWAMLSAAKNPDPAWQFLKFMTSEKAQLEEVAAGATTPSRIKVVQSDAFIKRDKPKNAKGFAQAQGYVVRDPVHVKWPQVQIEVVAAQMALLFSGKADPATVAKTIKEKGDAAFKA